MPIDKVYDSTCSDILRELGHAYPRTCLKCGLGPCKVPGVVMLAYKTKPDDPKMATGSEIEARFDAGVKEFEADVRELVAKAEERYRSRLADIMREMAERIAPVKDAGDGYETGD